MEDLAAALADVRRAHRLLHAYQTRVNDLYALIGAELREHGLEYARWYAIGHRRPPQRSSSFFDGRWAWDMLPSQGLGAVFTGRKRGGGPVKVHLQVIADTGFEGWDGPGEPDAAGFEPVEESVSVLRWSVWRGDSRVQAMDGAGAALHEKYGDAAADGNEHVFDFAGGQVRHWYGWSDLAELADQDAVRAKVVARMTAALTA